MATKQITNEDYHKRINTVIDYIHDNLSKNLSLDNLASIACFSSYHWHRIYQSISGETIKRTVRRLRLQRAAKELVDTDISIDRIAKKAGYDNTDSFTRKFSEDFDLPPNSYRTRGKLIIHEIKEPTNKSKDNYDVEIKTINSKTLATMDHVGDYIEIGRAFEKVFAWGAGQGLLNENIRAFGIYFDDPNAVSSKDLKSKAGFLVDDNFKDNDRVKKYIIHGGKYAVIIHKGAYSELETAYKWLYGTWLINSGKEPDDKPVIEEYLNNPREVPPSELLTAIFLPIK